MRNASDYFSLPPSLLLPSLPPFPSIRFLTRKSVADERPSLTLRSSKEAADDAVSKLYSQVATSLARWGRDFSFALLALSLIKRR